MTRVAWLRRLCVELIALADDRLLGHRWYWLCDALCESDWYGPPDEVDGGVQVWHSWFGTKKVMG